MRFSLGVSLAALLVAAPLVAGPALAADDVVAAAKAAVAAAVKPNPPWDGPTTGPKIQAGKTIVYVSTDERNGGARGVGQAVTEAGGLAGWTVRTLDGQGSVSGRSAALNQAIALQPDGIVLGGIDAAEQAAAIDAARAANIPVVGWHATASAGPSADGKVFTNIAKGPAPRDAVEGRLNIRPYGQQQGSIDPESPFTADRCVQAYNMRMCVTCDPANQIMLAEPPPGYEDVGVCAVPG